MRTLTVLVLVVIASVTVAACQGARTSPVSPSPIASAPVTPGAPLPPGTISIKGTVSDTAFRSLVGARIEVLDGPQAGLVTTSNDRGEFFFTGVFDDSTRFHASKEGHLAATSVLAPYCDRCIPHRYVHFSLDLPGEPIVLAGRYDVTFAIDSTCPGFPAELRARTTQATIPDNARRNFTVQLSGPTYAADSLLYAGVAGDYLSIWMEGFAEQLSPNQFLIYSFVATATTESSPQRIEAGGAGRVMYCELPATSGRVNECYNLPAAIKSSCDRSDHRLIFSRR